MDFLLVALPVLFFVPVLVRASGAGGGERTGFLAEFVAGLRMLVLVPHGIGLETKRCAPRVWWSTLLYRICWGALVALVAYVVWRRLA